LDLRRIDADRFQAVANRLGHLALALLSHGRVEAGVQDNRVGRPDNRPDVEVERLQHVMWVAADEIFRGVAIVMPVANGINLMGAVAHSVLRQGDVQMPDRSTRDAVCRAVSATWGSLR